MDGTILAGYAEDIATSMSDAYNGSEDVFVGEPVDGHIPLQLSSKVVSRSKVRRIVARSLRSINRNSHRCARSESDW